MLELLAIGVRLTDTNLLPKLVSSGHWGSPPLSWIVSILVITERLGVRLASLATRNHASRIQFASENTVQLCRQTFHLWCYLPTVQDSEAFFGHNYQTWWWIQIVCFTGLLVVGWYWRYKVLFSCSQQSISNQNRQPSAFQTTLFNHHNPFRLKSFPNSKYGYRCCCRRNRWCWPSVGRSN